MPLPKPPRKPRGVPQHRRDLQTMEKPMPDSSLDAFPHLERASQRVDAIQRQARAWSKPTKVDLAIAGTAGLGVLALGRRKKEVGKLARTQDGTNVRHLQPRHPSGRFVSHTNDLMVIHPRYSTSRRAPRDSKLQCWGKGKDGASQTYLGKADTDSLAESMLAGGARRGRRLV